MKPKNRLLLFICACVPGCGQMYQGYMKRGLSLCSICFGGFFLAFLLQFEALLFLFPLIFLYSFFDAFNIRAQLEEGQKEADTYIFGIPDIDSKRLNVLLRKRHSIIGWGLLLLGIYMLYDSLIDGILRRFTNYFERFEWLYSILRWDFPRILATVFIILLGLWFIRGPKGSEQDEYEYEEETLHFTPPPESPETPRPAYRPEFFTEAPHAPDPFDLHRSEAPDAPADTKETADGNP